MKRSLSLIIFLAFISGQVLAQALIPFEFTSEEDNKLLKENDSVKFYEASGDSSNMVSLNEESLYYKLLSKDYKVLAEGAYITEGEKFIQDGKWVARYENGKPKITGAYRKNLPIGTWHEYFSNGKLQLVTNYAIITGEHGETFYCMSGTYQEYYENGKIKTSGYYAAGIIKVADTIYVTDPVSEKTVVKYNSHGEYYPEKTGHWEYYTESGELDKKEDF